MIHHIVLLLIGFLVGFAGSLYFDYRRAGKVPIVGGMIQDKIEEGLGLDNRPDPIERDFQKRRREERKKDST